MHEFIFEDGTRVSDLESLLNVLKEKPWLYNSHVSLNRNDFAAWVRDCIDKDLAGVLFATTSYEEFLQVLENYLQPKQGEQGLTQRTQNTGVSRVGATTSNKALRSAIANPDKLIEVLRRESIFYEKELIKEFLLGLLFGVILSFIVARVIHLV